jgi:hypothetical protein
MLASYPGGAILDWGTNHITIRIEAATTEGYADAGRHRRYHNSGADRGTNLFLGHPVLGRRPSLADIHSLEDLEPRAVFLGSARPRRIRSLQKLVRVR